MIQNERGIQGKQEEGAGRGDGIKYKATEAEGNTREGEQGTERGLGAKSTRQQKQGKKGCRPGGAEGFVHRRLP